VVFLAQNPGFPVVETAEEMRYLDPDVGPRGGWWAQHGLGTTL
jgi:hypothetical protein